MCPIIDLFAGAGGLSLGAARAGFEIRAAVEYEKNAINTHRLNFPNTIHIECDIADLKVSDLLKRARISKNEAFGIIGGPPCQGFSYIGKQNLKDRRNSLFVKFFEIVKDAQPIFFVAENVLGILDEKYVPIREKAFSYVKDYTLLEPLRIKASDYGAPTTRTRVFFIGFKNNYFSRGIYCDDFLPQDQTFDTINVEKALEGLPQNIRFRSKTNNGLKSLTKDYMDGKKPKKQPPYFYLRTTSHIPSGVGNRSYIEKYFSNGIVNGIKPTKHSKEVKKRFRNIQPGGRDNVSKCIRLDAKGLCPTLRAGTGPEHGSFQAVRPIHYRFNRVITPREAARLQGFPDWFLLPDTIWHSFRQIGNSVSPIVAEYILSIINQKLTW